MSAPHKQPATFPDPPAGIVYLRSAVELFARRDLDAYQHLLLRAWDDMGLDGVLVVRGIPTVYLREDDRELPPDEVHALQRKLWNQGVATLLVLVDGKRTRIFSGMVPPRITPQQRRDEAPLDSFVGELDLAGQALRAHRHDAVHVYRTFCRQVSSGQYYRRHNLDGKAGAKKFDPREMVDAYLLDQLAAVRNELTHGKHKLGVATAHAFLGRLLFTCYLIDRGIVVLSERKYFPNQPWETLREVLRGGDTEVFDRLYKRLFPQLKRDFNGSMFDDSDLDAERVTIHPSHLKTVRDFFEGHDIGRSQRTLGFWAYDFSFIPVETISAIYENFLENENVAEKREDGAYYTPRFLAEMTLDVALEGRTKSLAGRRFLDASCGSGIFLVLLFNRLAAEWTARHQATAQRDTQRAYQAKDKALRAALRSLRGVDKNATACRVACFSLYLAFLDRFTPCDVRTYMQQSDRNKLPNLLQHQDGRAKKPDIPVIWHGDFFPLAERWAAENGERFDYIVGNPPWAGRGKKQIAHDFMAHTPALLRPDGKAALLLPTKVFFNKTDAFQREWLRAVSLEKVVQLSDYRFILFTGAVCPCLIARFNPNAPAIETHRVEYLTPKVVRVDLRQGAIPIAPGDRKELPLRMLLGAVENQAATMAWKSRFWGTQRDVKFLQHLFALPKLGDRVDQLSLTRGNRRHDWVAGQGGKPWSLNSTRTPDRALRPFNEPQDKWSPEDSLATPKGLEGQIFVPEELCGTLREHFVSEKYSLTELYSKPPAALFTPPLVLFNQGFSDAAFFDFTVRFQHSLQSIAGPRDEPDGLLFLAAYLRSRLARYFAFHTSANIGMERDKVHLDEVLSLPFYLPGHPDAASPDAATLLKRVVGKLRGLQARMTESAAKLVERLKDMQNPKAFKLQHGDERKATDERKKWLSGWAAKTAKTQEEIEPLLYEYFGLIDQERALVEDTCDIFDKSDTPGRLDTPMPTLEPLNAADLKTYAAMLTETLREWSRERKLSLQLTAGVDDELGLAVLKVEQARSGGDFRSAALAKELAQAVARIEENATTASGSLVYLRDETWWFDGPRIFVAKPALRGRWTRTAALNDSADFYAAIQRSRQS